MLCGVQQSMESDHTFRDSHIHERSDEGLPTRKNGQYGLKGDAGPKVEDLVAHLQPDISASQHETSLTIIFISHTLLTPHETLRDI